MKKMYMEDKDKLFMKMTSNVSYGDWNKVVAEASFMTPDGQFVKAQQEDYKIMNPTIKEEVSDDTFNEITEYFFALGLACGRNLYKKEYEIR